MKKEDISFAAFIILIIVLILLSGCTTERKAAKYFNNHTLKAASYCDSHFPVIPDTVFRKGKEVVKSDTTHVIDSVACPPNLKDTTYIRVPIKTVIHDSILSTDTITVIKTSTAQSAIINEQAKTIDKITNSRNDWRLRAIVTWAILAALIALILIFKI